jgi:hypothetical protein
MSNSAWSQETSVIPAKHNLYIGVYSNISMNYISLDGSTLRGNIPYNLQDGGSGNGFSFGGVLESYNFKPLILGVSVGYFAYNVNFKFEDDNEAKLVKDQLDPNKNNLVYQSVENNYYLKSQLMDISTYLAYNIFGNLNIKAGLYFGILSTTNLKSASDTLINNKINSIGPGAESVIRSSGVEIWGYLLGLSYDFSLNGKKTFVLSPEIDIRMGIKKLDNSTYNTTHSFVAGLVLKYAI